MKKAQVHTGGIYLVKVSGRLTRVRLGRECQYGGWYGTNIATGREVRIRSAARLRADLSAPSRQREAGNCPANS